MQRIFLRTVSVNFYVSYTLHSASIPYQNARCLKKSKVKFLDNFSNWLRPGNTAALKNIEILTKATGKLLLFDESVGRWRYSLYVTNLDLPGEQIWLSYKDRADAENRIKELKYDFGLDSFRMDKFCATEAAFRTIMIGYNLMSLFRQIVLQSKSQATLSTLRFIPLWREGSWITKHAGKTTLNISATGEKQKWLDGLFDIVKHKDRLFYFSNA